MERNEMLKMLHEQRTAAKLVVLSSEMAIECTYVSKQGFKYEWIAIDQWPASTIIFTSKDIFQKIIKRIGEQSLKLEDIQGTVLWTIYTDLFEKTGDVNVIFSELANIEYPEDGKVYLLRTSEGARFFSKYDVFEARFFEEFVADCTLWDTLSDNELELFCIRGTNYLLKPVHWITYGGSVWMQATRTARIPASGTAQICSARYSCSFERS